MAVKDQDSQGKGGIRSNYTRSYGTVNHVGENGAASGSQVSKGEDYSAQNETATKEHHRRALSNCERFSYGVGHVLNDLTASMWFSYMLVFLHQVNNFENLLAGNLMLIGQVSDALFTPFIGIESDRTRGFWKLGRRKTWHLLGTTCVLATFAFLFTECITCSHAPDIAQFVYYAPFVVIFQFGWASTQISHLSFSSDISPYKHERVTLQSIRNSFTVMANLSVYGIFLGLFYLEGKNGATDDNLSEADAPAFQKLAFICLALGTIFNLIFYFGTKEKRGDAGCQAPDPETDEYPEGLASIEKSTLKHARMSWKDWLKERQFYQIAVLYMSTRLYINVSQVFFSMYLTETLGMTKQSIALLPLVTYCSSFLMSFLASFINRVAGRKLAFLIGLAIGAGSCTWLYFIPQRDPQVYGGAVFMGAAGSLLLITSLSMTSDLIANNTESGAFVFGAMSFTDKLSNGIAILLIQKFHPCVGCCPLCEPYYRNVQCLVPGGALVMACIALLTLIPQDIGVRRVGPSAVKVLQNPVTSNPADADSLTDSLQCSCGLIYTPPSTCSACGVPPRFQVNGAITHHAEVYSRYSDDDDDDDSTNSENEPYNEKKPLLGSNINAPPADLHYHTENGHISH